MGDGRSKPGARSWEIAAEFLIFNFYFETHSRPTLARCYPRSFTFYVAIPIRSILISDSSFRVESAIDSFIRYLAVERGLSDNYQLSTQRSLNDFATWCAEKNRGPRSAA